MAQAFIVRTRGGEGLFSAMKDQGNNVTGQRPFFRSDAALEERLTLTDPTSWRRRL